MIIDDKTKDENYNMILTEKYEKYHNMILTDNYEKYYYHLEKLISMHILQVKKYSHLIKAE